MSQGTIVDKVWDSHVVKSHGDGPDALFIDLHMIVEVTSLRAFEWLRSRGIGVTYPNLTFGVADHAVPTDADRASRLVPGRAGLLISTLTRNCRDHGITLHGMNDPSQGIVHVIAPEHGRVQPGMTVVCGDSHTSTLGALGTVAFGIGTSAVTNVLATQMLLLERPGVMEIVADGLLQEGVSSKDLILAIASRFGTSIAKGYAVEFRGPAIRALSMEARMSICNMSIEIGGRCGAISPDETTFAYLEPRVTPARPWPETVSYWSSFATDEQATFDKSITFRADSCKPMISFGTSPSMSVPIDEKIPSWSPGRTESEDQYRRALAYMSFREEQELLGHPIDVVFIGSCTNSRIEDLRSAATILRLHHVAPNVRLAVVPGSQAVKRQAEAEGLADIFIEAGAEWHQSGCSMCCGVNGDFLRSGQYAVSTANRNFEGRQGPGVRTLLASPLTAAACAVTGGIADPRQVLGG
jgi:3-isopropylmalate/(R)-2-methylmalate dehydratase large subunit